VIEAYLGGVAELEAVGDAAAGTGAPA